MSTSDRDFLRIFSTEILRIPWIYSFLSSKEAQFSAISGFSWSRSWKNLSLFWSKTSTFKFSSNLGQTKWFPTDWLETLVFSLIKFIIENIEIFTISLNSSCHKESIIGFFHGFEQVFTEKGYLHRKFA